jgi:hypothetical protein
LLRRRFYTENRANLRGHLAITHFSRGYRGDPGCGCQQTVNHCKQCRKWPWQRLTEVFGPLCLLPRPLPQLVVLHQRSVRLHGRHSHDCGLRLARSNSRLSGRRSDRRTERQVFRMWVSPVGNTIHEAVACLKGVHQILSRSPSLTSKPIRCLAPEGASPLKHTCARNF